MQIRKITAGLGVTAQPRQYEAFRIDITLEADVEEGENIDMAATMLRNEISRQLHTAIEVEIEKLYGKDVAKKVMKDAEGKGVRGF